MKLVQRCSAIAVVLILAPILIAHQPAFGQSELKQFAASLDEARLNDEILLVYFFSSELDHPSDLLALFAGDARESFDKQLRVLDIDVSSPQGFEIADAFFGVGELEPQHQKVPILGVVQRNGRRGISLLPASADVLDRDDWLLFEKNIGTN